MSYLSALRKQCGNENMTLAYALPSDPNSLRLYCTNDDREVFSQMKSSKLRWRRLIVGFLFNELGRPIRIRVFVDEFGRHIRIRLLLDELLWCVVVVRFPLDKPFRRIIVVKLLLDEIGIIVRLALDFDRLLRFRCALGLKRSFCALSRR